MARRSPAECDGMIEVEIPIKTVSEANMREHWGVKHGRQILQSNAVAYGLFPYRTEIAEFKLPLAISFTRIGKRELDSDNLQSAFKKIRDKVAAILSVNDGDKQIKWDYQQEKGSRYAIRIKVEQL